MEETEVLPHSNSLSSDRKGQLPVKQLYLSWHARRCNDMHGKQRL